VKHTPVLTIFLYFSCSSVRKNKEKKTRRFPDEAQRQKKNCCEFYSSMGSRPDPTAHRSTFVVPPGQFEREPSDMQK
jgi:hypothetical protein